MYNTPTHTGIRNAISPMRHRAQGLENLLAQVRQDENSDTFETALTPHLAQLCRLACRFTGNETDAKKLVQNWLMEVYPYRKTLLQKTHLQRILAESLYNYYVEGVCRNTCNANNSRKDRRFRMARAHLLMMFIE